MDFSKAVIPSMSQHSKYANVHLAGGGEKSSIDYCRLLVPPLLTEVKLSLLVEGDSWVIPMGSLFSLDKTSLRARHDEG